ncbi:MAG: tetratricopeptide repeat protein [Planctomycetaceae bacterium]
MSQARRKKKRPTAVVQHESTRQVGDFAALRRMLTASQHTFSLSFAVCNDRHLRNELIEALQAEFADVFLLELPTDTSDVYALAKNNRPAARPAAIFVLDLEASLPFRATTYPALKSLNSSRELWESFACPVVFWIADYAAALIATHAQDFWRYRSHQFEFVAERAHVSDAIAEPFPGYEMIDALPFEEKRFRIAELEQRLREVGEEPSLDLLPHSINWSFELARLFEHTNQYDRGLKQLERARRWAETSYGSDDSRTASALGNLGHLLASIGRLNEAESLARQALAIDEKNLEPDDPRIATRLDNLARILLLTNRLPEAEALLRRELEILSRTPTSASWLASHCLNNLAMILKETNRKDEAELYMRKALEIDEAVVGPRHPRTSTSMNNLANLLENTNRLAESETLMRNVLEIDTHFFGTNHPNVARDLSNLATLLNKTNRLSEAEPLLRRALKIDEDCLGPQHPDVAVDLNNLAILLEDMSRHEEAEPQLKRALEIFKIFKHQTGFEHPAFQRAMNNYRSLLQALGKSEEEATEALETVLAGH